MIQVPSLLQAAEGPPAKARTSAAAPFRLPGRRGHSHKAPCCHRPPVSCLYGQPPRLSFPGPLYPDLCDIAPEALQTHWNTWIF